MGAVHVFQAAGVVSLHYKQAHREVEEVLYHSTKCVQHWSWKLFLYVAEIATHMVFLGQHLLEETK